MPTESQETALDRKLAEIRRAAEERDAERRAKRSGYPYVDLTKVPIGIEAVRVIPEADARGAKVAAIEIKVRELAVAAFDPQAPAVQKALQELEAKKYTTHLFVASLSGLSEAWKLYKFASGTTKEISGKVEIEKQRFEELLKRLVTTKAVGDELSGADFYKLTTTALFEIILAGALANRASDIHFEAEEKKVKIRLRLDGVLHDVFEGLPKHNYDALISRIKLLSNLKINIYGEPQDGRFTIDLPGLEDIEVRVSIIPSEFGETIVMRVLDPAATKVQLLELGMRPDILKLAKDALARPNGLILNTGPTGSGKTTTLYAFLRAVLSPEIKIVTIEDPIEYRIEGVEQTQVNPEVGYTFASGLKAILRQDPDVILVGEIRDGETADIAFQASLTGHLVLSTLHANDAVATVPRLIDLGLKPETIGPSLTLVIAQRLVRVLCKECKKEKKLSADLKKKIETFIRALPPQVDRARYGHPKVFEPGACGACNHTGYKGRVGIFEFLVAGPEFEELILKASSEVAMRTLAKKEGLVTFQEDGILKTITGETSFEEVEKVTGPITWK